MNNLHLYGLTSQEVTESKKAHGGNTLTRQKQKSFLKLFFESFNDPIIKILLIALFISVFFLFSGGNILETLGILAAILIATLVSAISERQNQRAFEKLNALSKQSTSKVIRNTQELLINSSELVVGDCVLIEAGDKIPADAEIVYGAFLVNQASLNGESKEAKKYVLKTNAKNDHDFLHPNFVFASSVVTSGYGIIRLLKVGDNTFYGRLAQEVQTENRESPLKIRLNTLAKTLSKIGYFSAILVALAYLFNTFFIDTKFDMVKTLMLLQDIPFVINNLFYSLTLAISLIVVAVPEGLPMMISVVLSSNMKRMLKDKVLVKKLVSVETSGSINLLCFDKTGTITEGNLKPTTFVSSSLNSFNVNSYPIRLSEIVNLSLTLNNSASFATDENNKQVIVGSNSTDRALLSSTNQISTNYEITNKIEFNSISKFSSISTRNLPFGFKTLVKGAFEKLLARCTTKLTENGEIISLTNSSPVLNNLNNLAKLGYRVILLCASHNEIKNESDLDNLTLIGAVCLKDCIRKESKDVIANLNKAGIQTIMITGDSKETATSIAKECNLVKSNKDIILTSIEFNNLSDDEILKLLPNLRVLARSLPTDKSRLVNLATSVNYVVGMTGDGTNDAPAVKKADVGFAMGSGSEVCKEAADMIILNDNLSSISKAIIYGRTIFKSIRKFIIFQLSINFAAVLISVVSPLIGIDTPITIMQMLWINMIIDTLAGLAFSGEPPLKEYLDEKPKKRDEKIITKPMWVQILCASSSIFVIGLLLFKLPALQDVFNRFTGSLPLMSAFFIFFVFAGVFNMYSSRTTRLNLFAYLNKNKRFVFISIAILFIQLLLVISFGSVFRSIAPTPVEFLTVFALAMSVIPVDLARKLIIKKVAKKQLAT